MLNQRNDTEKVLERFILPTTLSGKGWWRYGHDIPRRAERKNNKRTAKKDQEKKVPSENIEV